MIQKAAALIKEVRGLTSITNEVIQVLFLINPTLGSKILKVKHEVLSTKS